MGEKHTKCVSVRYNPANLQRLQCYQLQFGLNFIIHFLHHYFINGFSIGLLLPADKYKMPGQQRGLSPAANN
jgi:hypothetical protein